MNIPALQGGAPVLVRLAAGGSAEKRVQTLVQATGIGPTKGAAFSLKLEKHLDDVRKGRGELSSDVYRAISKKHLENGQLLTESDPGFLTLYSGYLSGLSYGQSSRFAQSVNETSKNVRQIDSEAEIDALETDIRRRLEELEQASRARAATEVSPQTEAEPPLSPVHSS